MENDKERWSRALVPDFWAPIKTARALHVLDRSTANLAPGPQWLKLTANRQAWQKNPLGREQ
jgi:hypothetical protein